LIIPSMADKYFDTIYLAKSAYCELQSHMGAQTLAVRRWFHANPLFPTIKIGIPPFQNVFLVSTDHAFWMLNFIKSYYIILPAVMGGEGGFILVNQKNINWIIKMNFSKSFVHIITYFFSCRRIYCVNECFNMILFGRIQYLATFIPIV